MGRSLKKGPYVEVRLLARIEELNAAIGKQLEQHNARFFKGKNYSRKKLFEDEEKQLLRELPSSRYEIKHVAFGKVQRNYHLVLGEDYHQYSFEVHPKATKGQIARAVEEIFRVRVMKVHTLKIHGKTRRTGRFEGQRPDSKRAIVSIGKDQKIDFEKV